MPGDRHPRSLPEVRGGVSTADGGAVLSYKSEMSYNVNSFPGSSAIAVRGRSSRNHARQGCHITNRGKIYMEKAL